MLICVRHLFFFIASSRVMILYCLYCAYSILYIWYILTWTFHLTITVCVLLSNAGSWTIGGTARPRYRTARSWTLRLRPQGIHSPSTRLNLKFELVCFSILLFSCPHPCSPIARKIKWLQLVVYASPFFFLIFQKPAFVFETKHMSHVAMAFLKDLDGRL